MQSIHSRTSAIRESTMVARGRGLSPRVTAGGTSPAARSEEHGCSRDAPPRLALPLAPRPGLGPFLHQPRRPALDSTKGAMHLFAGDDAAGQLVIPTFNGLLRVDKPALLYCCKLPPTRTRGQRIPARLPSAVAASLPFCCATSWPDRCSRPPQGCLPAWSRPHAHALRSSRFANPTRWLICSSC